MNRHSKILVALLGTLSPATVFAQTPVGAAPAQGKVEVADVKAPAAEPTLGRPSTDMTSVTMAAGGLLTSGNTKTTALTGKGVFDMRRDNNGVGGYLLGNYAKGGTPQVESAKNWEARARYDRYLNDDMSLFAIATGRHDKFQGLLFRLNLDPGFKWIAHQNEVSAAWLEAGYDFLYDIRTDSGRVQLNDDKTPKLDAAGALLPLLDKTRTDHSVRLFGGYRRSLNTDVTFSTGIEYLQSFVKTDLGSAASRLTFDALVAAKLFSGFSLGFGFNARFDSQPLPGKEELDTTTTLSIIYGWTDAKPAKEAAKCPACPEPPPCPVAAPVAAPAAPAAAPPPAGAATQPAAPSNDVGGSMTITTPKP